MGLHLRPLTIADAEELASWATDPVFCAHAGWRQRPASTDAVAWWCESIARPDPLLMRLMAVHDGVPVGYVDLHGGAPDTRELGFVIGPSHRWHRGLGTAAATAGLSYGFLTLGLSSVWAEALEANVGSVRILRRVGMRETGFGATEVFLGAPSRYVQFALSRDRWLAMTGSEEVAPPMSRILITGMSGAGKSTLLAELARRGHVTIDTDVDGWTIDDARWDEPRMTALLASQDDIVVSGTVENQGLFSDRFAHVVLLSAPNEVLIERVTTRTSNPYGRTPVQQADIRRYVEEVEPLLRRGASLELDGRRPVAELADVIERLHAK
ncbi:MAG: GNAT family N-acetyltransferase [Microbacterium sp.]